MVALPVHQWMVAGSTVGPLSAVVPLMCCRCLLGSDDEKTFERIIQVGDDQLMRIIFFFCLNSTIFFIVKFHDMHNMFVYVQAQSGSWKLTNILRIYNGTCFDGKNCIDHGNHDDRPLCLPLGTLSAWINHTARKLRSVSQVSPWSLDYLSTNLTNTIYPFY